MTKRTFKRIQGPLYHCNRIVFFQLKVCKLCLLSFNCESKGALGLTALHNAQLASTVHQEDHLNMQGLHYVISWSFGPASDCL